MNLELPQNIIKRLQHENSGLKKSMQNRVIEILETALPPDKNLNPVYIENGIKKLKKLLLKIPCINNVASCNGKNPFWWLKFQIDIDSKIAWNVVQELGHILNYLSVNEKLPTRFYPVSPPPYLNGAPKEFLSWVIEASIPYVDSNYIYDFLKGRLPENFEIEDSWLLDV